MHPFLVMRFRDAAWPRIASRWLLVSQGPVGDDGYVCGTVSGHAESSEVRVFSSMEQCDAEVTEAYERELEEDGYTFTGESAVVTLDPGLVLEQRGEKGWPVKMMYALQDAYMARDVPGPSSTVRWPSSIGYLFG